MVREESSVYVLSHSHFRAEWVFIGTIVVLSQLDAIGIVCEASIAGGVQQPIEGKASSHMTVVVVLITSLSDSKGQLRAIMVFLLS